jgi:hypothetical protein
LALDAEVNDAAKQYNLPIYTAAFWVMNDIRDYHKIGGLKKQLETLCAQVYAVREL